MKDEKVPVSKGMFMHVFCPMYAAQMTSLKLKDRICMQGVRMLGKFFYDCPQWYEKQVCWRTFESLMPQQYETLMKKGV